MRTGRCTNFGNCSLADSKQALQIPTGNDLICPECKRPLTETTPQARRTNLAVPALLVVLLLLGGIAYLLLRPSKSVGTDTRGAAVPAVQQGASALRLHGSNTIGAQLAPALAEAFFRADGASDVKTTPQAADEVRVSASYPGDSTPRVIEIQAHGSGTAFKDMVAGSADIGMASRKITAAEAQSLAGMGDMTSQAAEHVLGLDGIAVIVSRSNPVTTLTKQQIAGLFAGTLAWSAVSGPAGAANIYARDDKSGTYDTFKTVVLGNLSLAAGAKRFEDSRQLSDAVASDPAGIGFVGLPYIGSAKAVSVSEPGARALLPNRFTVATEDYLLSRRLYLYSSTNPTPLARKFIDFALSAKGQEVVAATGFIAQTVRAESADLSASGATSQYRQVTTGGQRLSVNFRFRTGSSLLDNKALDDIDRVTSLLSDLKYTGRNVLLLGFADSTGSPQKNTELSKERASAVAAQFSQRGVQPGTITGFGADMPVASNDTEDGRQKNRRVEIWVKK